MTERQRPHRNRARPSGFTLIELLVTIGIIVVLLGILIPMVAKVRQSAQVAGVRNQISQIQGAIERFQIEQRRFPGPLADNSIATGIRQVGKPFPEVHDKAGTALGDQDLITGSENLLLGLLGGLKWLDSPGGGGPKLVFDPDMVGRGMVSMNPQQPKKFLPYLEKVPAQVSAGHLADGAGEANDSVIPELLDTFPNPLPFLYLRARPGAAGVIVNNKANNALTAQYVLSDILGYTEGKPGRGSIGEGKKIGVKDYVGYTGGNNGTPSHSLLPHGLRDANPAKVFEKGHKDYQFPYDAYRYFASPTDPTGNTPRSKDTYVLISAGVDRVYGTSDDLTNFGSVLPD